MSDPSKNPFDLLLDQIRAVIAEEIAKALDKPKPQKLQFTTREAADMINVPESWLAAKARAGEIPHRMMGHYRMFSLGDLQEILDSGRVPAAYSLNDGQRTSQNPQTIRVKPSQTRKGA